jgi:hypothetical protein
MTIKTRADVFKKDVPRRKICVDVRKVKQHRTSQSQRNKGDCTKIFIVCVMHSRCHGNDVMGFLALWLA